MPRTPRQQLYVPLHCHSEFSWLDSIVKIKGLGRTLKAKGFHSYAITDHGNINGAYSFYKELKANGVKPIIGIEFYYCFDRTRKGLTDEEKEKYLKGYKGNELKEKTKELKKQLKINERFHIVALAKNQQGFKDIINAVEKSHTEGFYRFPRIDTTLLEGLALNCIILTACLAGVPVKLCREGRSEEAIGWCKYMKKVFGNDFYLEIQPNDMEMQVEANKNILYISRQLNIPLVATNDVHYINQEDWETHDVLLALRDSQRGNTVYVDDPDRFRYDTHSLYLKTDKEMALSFKKFHSYLPDNIWKQALLNTNEIDKKIEEDVIVKRSGVLPNIDTFELTPDQYLMKLIREGWARKKLNKKLSEDEIVVYQERVLYEYDIITKLGFSKYFIVVYDLIKWAKDNEIMVGPGRGSVGGSIIAYLIGITDVDSIKWNCPFSRFITEDRVDYPDIDCDFPSDNRDQIRTYLIEKYGEDQVAGICNFNRMKAKQTLRDIARIFRVPYLEVNNITKQLISRAPGEDREFNCIEDSVQLSEDFKKFKNQYQHVTQHAMKLEGLCRQLGMHAAGIVVTDEPVRNIVPTQVQRRAKGKDEGEYIAGWDKRQVEEVGLIKLDILGIDVLSYIQRTLDLLKKKGEIVKLEKIEDFDDQDIWEAFQEGYTELVWQLNQPSAVRLLKKLKPESLDHIVAANALLRPGPLTSGITEEYIQRRHGEKGHESVHEKLDEILFNTYGLMVFQEDVIKIAHDMGGFTWAEADKLRKAIGKKRIDKILELKDKFIDGFERLGYGKEVGKIIFGQIEEHARYSFNKSHSLAYSLLSYWTMYLKIKYPLEFITAALEVESNEDKRRLIIREGKRLGIKLLPPDINISNENVTIDPYRENVILSGFKGVKGFGKAALSNILDNRPFVDFRDFVIKSGVNKTQVSILLKTGTLDSLVEFPKTIDDNIETILHVKKLKRQDKYWQEKVSPILNEEGEKFTQEERDKYCLEYLALPPENHIVNNYVDKFKDKLDIQKISDVQDIFDQEYSSNYEWFVVSVNKCKVYEDIDKRTASLVVEDDTGQIQISISQGVLDRVGLDNIDKGLVLLVAAKSHGFEKLKAGYVQNLNIDESLGFLEVLEKSETKALNYSQGNKEIDLYILGIDVFNTRNGNTMATMCVMDNKYNVKDVVVWPDDLRKYCEKLNNEIEIKCTIQAKKSLDRGQQYMLNTNKQRNGGTILNY